MISIEAKGDNQVRRSLQAMSRDLQREEASRLMEVGRSTQTEAKKKCPVSPTQSQAKKGEFKEGRSPGTLQNSIIVKQGRGQVTVGILSGNALQYAERIHDGRGKSWRNLGSGSKNKGSQVTDKFVFKAWDDNEKEYVAYMRKGVDKVADKFNRGT